MGKVVTLPSSDISVGNIIGSVLELNDGSLIAGATQEGAWIKKSIDGGLTWTTKYTYPGGWFICRTIFQDSRGYVYLGITKSGVNVPILRSVDNGENWSIVATVECDGVWHIVEDALGYLYCNEYSVDVVAVVQGRNIWRSIDEGATWHKWYTNNRDIRHCHWIYVTTDQRYFTGFGDIDFTSEAGKSYELTQNGEEIREISAFGNGHTNIIEADNGDIFLQGDTVPNYVYKLNKYTNQVEQYLSILNEFGSIYDHVSEQGPVKGKDGVIYFSLHTKSAEPSYILASADDGVTWCIINYVSHNQEPRYVSVNRQIVGSRVYIGFKGTANYVSIPDYTRAELRALYTSYLTITRS